MVWKYYTWYCMHLLRLLNLVNGGTLHTIDVHVLFKTRVPNAHLRPSIGGSMNLIIQNTKKAMPPSTPLGDPHILHFSGGMHAKN